MADVRYGTARGRWVLAATVLGSGVAFLDGTVVNVALPAIARDLRASMAGLQWTVNAYLVTLSSLLLLGGSLGDRFGRRRVFVAGLAGFTAASLLAAIAPNQGFLIAARALQGVGGALLVPGSLAIIAAVFHADDRGRAIGAWSGLAGVASAIGPFLGGWLIDAVSWRLIFFINLPLAAVAIAIAVRHVPETAASDPKPLDLVGAPLATIALAGISFAAIRHQGTVSSIAALAGAAAAIAFIAVERTSSHPMLPLGIFRSAQFTGANLTTLAVYAGLSGALFLLVLRLQVSLAYSALAAGASLVPFTVIMLALSSTAGRVAQRIGPRVPMTVGPLVAAAGIALLARTEPGSTYLATVLPGVAVFGFGMAVTVAPLTSAVLASVTDDDTGVASGINNAVARLAGLLAVAIVPAVAGIATNGTLARSLDHGFGRALGLAAAITGMGGLVAAVTVRTSVAVEPLVHPSPVHACQDPGALKRAS